VIRFALILLLLPARALSSQVYVQEDLNFRNSAFVRVSEQANADLFFADLKVREKSWAEAVNAYQQILDREDDAIVPFGAGLPVRGGSGSAPARGAARRSAGAVRRAVR
jgi:hypothetical protein